MDEKLNVLPQLEDSAVSPVVAGDQSSESAEQEGGVQKITDKTETTQDYSKSSTETPKYIFVDSIIIYDEGSPEVRLRLESLFTGEIKYTTIKLADWTQNNLRKCIAENGYMSTDWKELYKRLSKEIEDFRQTYSRIKTIYGHTKVGWSKRAEDIVFYHKKMISSGNQSSEYMGGMDIDPKGSLDNIVNMIKQWILSTPKWSPLEAVIAFSVAAVVLPFVNRAFGKNLNNPILHLAGDSTTGKTTALRLHVGFASNPFNEKNGFWLNHQSSLVALIRKIGDNQGIPVGIDELSAADKKDYTYFVYAIGNGEEKDRLKAGGTGLCDSGSFSTVVVSSGEKSLLEKCSENTGIGARCFEFCNVNWTDSKEQAEGVCECLRTDYGMIAPLVAKELLNNSDKWKIRWDQLFDQINRQMDKDKIRLGIGARISEFVVLFTLAAEIANEVLGVSLNVNEIYDFCYGHIITTNASKENLCERAYEYLLSYAARNSDEFPEAEPGSIETVIGSYYSNKKIKGFYRDAKREKKISGKVYRHQLILFPETYRQILNERSFSPTLVSDELKKAGLLQTHDNNRATYHLTYNQTYLTCYAIYCRREDYMMYEAWANGTYDPFGEDDYDG